MAQISKWEVYLNNFSDTNSNVTVLEDFEHIKQTIRRDRVEFFTDGSVAVGQGLAGCDVFSPNLNIRKMCRLPEGC